MAKKLTLSKLSDDKFEGNHPNGVNQGRQFEYKFRLKGEIDNSQVDDSYGVYEDEESLPTSIPANLTPVVGLPYRFTYEEQENDGVVLYGHVRTSLVTEITEQNATSITFKTKNSTYKVELV